MEVRKITKLDYNITSLEERKKVVEQILEENPEPNEAYLEAMADYLVNCMEKLEKKEKAILTDNRMTTINKRETSFEGLVSQFENGEDGIYSLISDSKTTIFQPKVSITKKDIEDIPSLKQLKESIDAVEKLSKRAYGRDAYVLKKTLIDLRKDQYVIKNAYRKPIVFNKLTRSKVITKFDSGFEFDENGYVIPKGVSLCNPKVCSAILCNYSQLKQDSWGEYEGDLWYLIYDFERVCDKALESYPLYMRLMICKIDGMSNVEIQETIQQEFGIKHSLEYISSLWRKKIPNLIASAAEDEVLNWYYLNVENGKYKRCSRCGQVKLAHNKYFSRNKTSKDGFYSICKACRNARTKEQSKSKNIY